MIHRGFLIRGRILLTTGVDTVPGSTATEVITGGSTALSSTDTLQASDQIDGGAGKDTLLLTLSKSFGGFTVGTGFLKGVETVNLTNASVSPAYDFTARAVSDVVTYNVNGPVNVKGLVSTTPVVNFTNLAGSATTALEVAFDQQAVSGSSDSFTLGLNSVGTARTSSSADHSDVTFTTTGIETLIINATGKNYVALAQGTSTATPVNLVVKGSGSLDLLPGGTTSLGAGTNEGVSEDLKTIDASALEGSLAVNLGQAESMTSIKGAQGGNTIYANMTDTTGDLVGNATVAGGAGADTLVLNLATGARTLGLSMTGVETLSLGSIAGGALTFSMSKVSGLSNIYVSNLAGQSSTISGAGSTDLSVSLQPDAASPANVDHTVSVDTTGTVTATIPIASSVTASSTSGIASSDSLTATKAGTVVLNVPKFADYDGTITAALATSMTIKGDGDLGWTNITTGTIVSADKLNTLVLEQTDKNEGWGLTLKTSATSVPSTVKDINLKLVGETVSTFAVDVSDHALVALESLTIDTATAFSGAAAGGTPIGNDSLLASENLTKLTSINLSGSADASKVHLGNVGGTTLAYGTTLTASGLKAGLSVGTMDVGPSQTINLNIAGVKGNTVFSALTTGTAGSVVMNANGHGNQSTAGTLTVGNVTAASGTVNLDFQNAKGAITVGTLTGNSVTVNATGAASTLGTTLGDAKTVAVAPKNSVVFSAPDLADTTLNVTLASTSTSFTGTLNGSILGDIYSITSTGTGQTSIILTGDMGDGTDTVNVTSTTSQASAGQTISLAGLTSYDQATIRTGSTKDTIIGGSGKDTIYSGSGADTINISSGGNDTIVYANILTEGTALDYVFDSNGSQAAFVNATTGTDNTTITGGSYVSTVLMDKIIGFGVGDKIVTNTATTTTPVANTTSLQTIGSKFGVGTSFAATPGALVEASNSDGTKTKAVDVFIRGSYTESSGRFTFNSGGADTLYLIDGDGTAGGSVYGVVLVGYVQGATSDITTGGGLTGLVGAAI